MEGKILQGEETQMVVVEVATLLYLLAVALPPPIRKIIEAVVTQILRLVQFVKCATRQDIRHQIAIIGMIILIPVTPPICMHCLQLRRSPWISTVSRFRCKSPSCSWSCQFKCEGRWISWSKSNSHWWRPWFDCKTHWFYSGRTDSRFQVRVCRR